MQEVHEEQFLMLQFYNQIKLEDSFVWCWVTNNDIWNSSQVCLLLDDNLLIYTNTNTFYVKSKWHWLQDEYNGVYF